MKTKKIVTKKLNLKKETISNMEKVKAGQAVPVKTFQDPVSDTCLCGPTFWDGCKTEFAVNYPQAALKNTHKCMPTFWENCEN